MARAKMSPCTGSQLPAERGAVSQGNLVHSWCWLLARARRTHFCSAIAEDVQSSLPPCQRCLYRALGWLLPSVMSHGVHPSSSHGLHRYRFTMCVNSAKSIVPLPSTSYSLNNNLSSSSFSLRPIACMALPNSSLHAHMSSLPSGGGSLPGTQTRSRKRARMENLSSKPEPSESNLANALRIALSRAAPESPANHLAIAAPASSSALHPHSSAQPQWEPAHQTAHERHPAGM